MANKPATQLSLKRQHFVAAYIADPAANGSRAAIAAGYSRRHAADAAHRLLHTPLVKAAVDRARQELAERGSFDALTAMRRLDDAAQFSRETKNATALARCIELQCRLAGLLIDKAQIQVEHIDISGTIIEARKRATLPTIHEAEYSEVPTNPFDK
jgi:hypothetical protein